MHLALESNKIAASAAQPASQQTYSPCCNTERLLSAMLGGALTVAGLRRGSLFGLVLGGCGAALTYRSITGRWSFWETFGLQFNGFDDDLDERQVRRKTGFPIFSGGDDPEPKDAVEEASMESFPASDPPAHVRTRV